MKNRPISPHLQIYKPQITSVLSIMHRLTGIFLSCGLVVLTFWLSSIVLGDEYYYEFSRFFEGFGGKFLLLMWTWSLFYHLGSGIRHLFWDAGFGYKMKTVKLSGYGVLALSTLLTAISWSFAYWGLLSSCPCMKGGA